MQAELSRIAAFDGLEAYPHQVGGHSSQDGLPASLLDPSRGHFLKQLQAGERGDREAALYAHAERVRIASSGGGAAQGCCAAGCTTGADAGWSEGEGAGCSGGGCAGATENASTSAHPTCRGCNGGRGGRGGAGSSGSGTNRGDDAGLRLLCRWIPRSFGVRSIGGHRYLALEDAAAGYAAPCVLDAKLGLRTWYPWAPPALVEKYRRKDEGTTQATMGFRLCGVRAQRLDGSEWRADRHWGKGLDRAGVLDALRRFVNNGALAPADVYGPVLAELAAMAGVFEAQAAYHLFSASVLVTYEGAARSATGARPAVRLIDFAHAFPPGGPRPPGPDTNFLAGLRGLAAAIQAVLAAPAGDAAAQRTAAG